MKKYTKTKIDPGLVAFYDIRPGNRAGLFLQPGACTGHIVPEPSQSNKQENNNNNAKTY